MKRLSSEGAWTVDVDTCVALVVRSSQQLTMSCSPGGWHPASAQWQQGWGHRTLRSCLPFSSVDPAVVSSGFSAPVCLGDSRPLGM